MASGIMTYVQADVILQRSDERLCSTNKFSERLQEIDDATTMKNLCVYKDSRRSEFVSEVLSLSLCRGAAGSGRDIGLRSPQGWNTPEEDRRERLGCPEAPSQERGHVPRALRCNRKGASGRKCGTIWPTAKRSPLRGFSQRARVVPEVARIVGVLCSESVPDFIVEEARRPWGCTKCSGMPVRCDAEACSGDCGTDFPTAAREKRVRLSNKRTKRNVTNRQQGDELHPLFSTSSSSATCKAARSNSMSCSTSSPQNDNIKQQVRAKWETTLLCRLARKTMKQFLNHCTIGS